MSDEIRAEQLDDEKEHERLRKIVEEKMPPEEDIYDLAELFKTFGDSTRMRILFVLLESEACVCGLASVLNMTDSAISHQLRILRSAGLVRPRRDGKTIFYSLDDEHIEKIYNMGLAHIMHKIGAQPKEDKK